MRLSEALARPEPTHSSGLHLSDIFEEQPVPLDVFIRDKKFLKNPPLWPDQYEAVRHVEQIYMPDLYPLMAEEWDEYWNPVRYINKATLQWGKGSGKDHVCRIMSMRVAYLLLCLKNPLEYYGMPDQDSIHLLNVASTAKQAQRAFFKPITRAAKRKGSWFADRCEPTMDAIAWAKNVESISGHSDAESQEGLNILLGVCDEVDAFKTLDEVAYTKARGSRDPTNTSDAIIEMMQTSSATRFPHVYKNVYISYPRYKGSKIQILTREARTDNEVEGEASMHYVSGPLATWDVRKNLSKEDFADDYKKDEALAKAKYECDPSLTTDPYFRNDVLVDEMFVEVPREPLKINYDLVKGRKGMLRWEPVFDIDPRILFPVQGACYAMHGDIAISGDLAGVAMAHVVRWEDTEQIAEDHEGGLVYNRVSAPVVKVDFVAHFSADISEKPPREVQVRWYRALVYHLQNLGFPVRRYTFDGFQSVDSQQLLELQGIESERVSMDLNDLPWKNLRDLAYESRISIPKPVNTSLNDLLVRVELGGLTRLPNGKVDHPPAGSKDEADAVCGAALGALIVGGMEAVDDKGEGVRAWPDMQSSIWVDDSSAIVEKPVGFTDMASLNLTPPDNW